MKSLLFPSLALVFVACAVEAARTNFSRGRTRGKALLGTRGTPASASSLLQSPLSRQEQYHGTALSEGGSSSDYVVESTWSDDHGYARTRIEVPSKGKTFVEPISQVADVSAKSSGICCGQQCPSLSFQHCSNGRAAAFCEDFAPRGLLEDRVSIPQTSASSWNSRRRAAAQQEAMALDLRLHRLGLKRVRMPPDGNCLYHALAFVVHNVVPPKTVVAPEETEVDKEGTRFSGSWTRVKELIRDELLRRYDVFRETLLTDYEEELKREFSRWQARNSYLQERAASSIPASWSRAAVVEECSGDDEFLGGQVLGEGAPGVVEQPCSSSTAPSWRSSTTSTPPRGRATTARSSSTRRASSASSAESKAADGGNSPASADSSSGVKFARLFSLPAPPSNFFSGWGDIFSAILNSGGSERGSKQLSQERGGAASSTRRDKAGWKGVTADAGASSVPSTGEVDPGTNHDSGAGTGRSSSSDENVLKKLPAEVVVSVVMKNGRWGGEAQIQAACDIFGLEIRIHQGEPDGRPELPDEGYVYRPNAQLWGSVGAGGSSPHEITVVHADDEVRVVPEEREHYNNQHEDPVAGPPPPTQMEFPVVHLAFLRFRSCGEHYDAATAKNKVARNNIPEDEVEKSVLVPPAWEGRGGPAVRPGYPTGAVEQLSGITEDTRRAGDPPRDGQVVECVEVTNNPESEVCRWSIASAAPTSGPWEEQRLFDHMVDTGVGVGHVERRPPREYQQPMFSQPPFSDNGRGQSSSKKAMQRATGETTNSDHICGLVPWTSVTSCIC